MHDKKALPSWAENCLAAIAPDLNRTKTSHEGGPTRHVMGSPYMHPNEDLMALLVIVRVCHRNKSRVKALSGGYLQHTRITTRFQWKRQSTEYVLYIIDGANMQVLEQSTHPNLLYASQALAEIANYWVDQYALAPMAG